uniref:Phytanoyl-CoA dioxygenase domain-containing protein 1 homolog n=1 Tax=Caenorhabditis japonica TaxID=281687 RepID=A0A8R1DTX7_CAEJA
MSTLREKFERDGFAVIDNVFDDAEIEEMKTAISRIVDEMELSEHPRSVFSTYDEDKHSADSYFLNSSDKIRFFFEEGAVDEQGELKVAKEKSLNKIGHGLHFLDPTFKKMTFNAKIQRIFGEIGYEEPEVVQSMYIFKQPKIGGAVTDHVDSTFLRVSPIDHLTGVWIAIDEASVENGCLSFIPGSHKDTSATDYRFVRTHDTSGGPLLKFVGTRPTYDPLKFQHVPIAKGSLILIHGLVVHKSEANTSDKSRHAYTIHVMEKKNTVWSEDNWLQETDEYKFPNLFKF